MGRTLREVTESTIILMVPFSRRLPAPEPMSIMRDNQLTKFEQGLGICDL